jgi:hypothetical protein
MLVPIVGNYVGYEIGMPSNGITSLSSFVKTGQLVKTLKRGHKENSMLLQDPLTT